MAAKAAMLAGAAVVGVASAVMSPTAPFVGAYVDLSVDGLAKLQLLAENAASLPLNRLWLSFFSPTMVYVPGSRTLANTGLNVSNEGPDYGFEALAASIQTLESAGVDVLLSMGGWDFNCMGYAYERYSVAGYGTNTPNYWKIQTYCGGNVAAGTPANEYCYVCEPPSANETENNFNMFPEPSFSATWQQAQAYVAATAGGAAPPTWDTTLINGQNWTDPLTGVLVPLPGSDLPWQLQRDPYADIVLLAKDLNASGIDIDYEEDWHADYHKNGPAGGPWTSEQTVYKYSAILKDVLINIEAHAPGMLLSTAAGAAGAWAGNWWGGNLKGTLLNAAQWYPQLVSYVASTGGVNVMSYDLSDNEAHYECPDPSVCTLDQQVAFYMQQFQLAGIPANVGYETGTPAYPDPVEDPSHQLPLTLAELQLITTQTQPQYAAGFFWEIFKQPTVPGQATPTQVAQAVCSVVLKGSPRCSGTIPVWTPPDATQA